MTRQTTLVAISTGLPRRSFTFTLSEVMLWMRVEILVRDSQGSTQRRPWVRSVPLIVAEQEDRRRLIGLEQIEAAQHEQESERAGDDEQTRRAPAYHWRASTTPSTIAARARSRTSSIT